MKSISALTLVAITLLYAGSALAGYESFQDPCKKKEGWADCFVGELSKPSSSR